MLLRLQVVFPSLLPLTYVPTFLTRIRQLFLSLFQPYIQALITSLSSGTSLLQSSITTVSERGQSALKILQDRIQIENWQGVLLRCLKNCEMKNGGKKVGTGLSASSARRAEVAAASATGDFLFNAKDR